MKTTISNDEPEASGARLSVLLVTVGNLTERETLHVLQPGQKVTVEVNAGQFVMVDETE